MSATSMKRLKVALIPILAAVLLVVVWKPGQEGGEGAAAPSTTELAIARASVPTKESPQQGKPAWPDVDLELLVQFDPFRCPPALKPPAPTADPSAARDGADERGTASDESAEQPQAALLPGQVQAIYETDAGAVALIDARVVRQGDVLDTGARVVEISTQGVVVEAP